VSRISLVRPQQFHRTPADSSQKRTRTSATRTGCLDSDVPGRLDRLELLAELEGDWSAEADDGAPHAEERLISVVADPKADAQSLGTSATARTSARQPQRYWQSGTMRGTATGDDRRHADHPDLLTVPVVVIRAIGEHRWTPLPQRGPLDVSLRNEAISRPNPPPVFSHGLPARSGADRCVYRQLHPCNSTHPRGPLGVRAAPWSARLLTRPGVTTVSRRAANAAALALIGSASAA
jgi:hypothetical protein